ncbi:hypothetical protein QT989_01680 [Microcoleus sp. SVA1_B6]|uniref:hypothetical protein n=1 Tax=Microcoleus sp. SVA1_B6 TaxID=2818952 RepID=UPI002FD006EB
MEDTAMPFPYAKIIVRAIEYNHRPIVRWRTRQCRFPTTKRSIARSDITIARSCDGGHGIAVSLQTVFLPMFKNANLAK